MPRLGMGLGAGRVLGGNLQNWDPHHLDDMEFNWRGGLGTDADPVTEWTNRGATGNNYVQATPADRPIIDDVNGRPSLLFDDAGDYMDYDGPLADATFLHDGTGATMFFAGKMTSNILPGYLWDNLREDSDQNGIGIQWVTGGTGRLRLRMGNSTGVWLVMDTSANDAWPDGSDLLMTIRTSTVTFGGQNYQVRINGNIAMQGVFTGAANPGPPAEQISVGRPTGGGGQFLGLNLGAQFAYSSLFTGANVALVEAWLTRIYTLSFP